MSNLQEQYDACVYTKLALGWDERSARANCRTQLLRIQQRDQARRGVPVTNTLDVSDNYVQPSDLPAEPVTPGVLSEPLARQARSRRKAA